jgi:crotonobetainyl-CoA:carnitine CoA-transferase CaiB-like acyl-CoA transferase
VACAKEKFFRTLAELLGMPEDEVESNYANFAARHERREALSAWLGQRFAERSTSEWLERLRGRVPCAPVRSLTEALDEHNLRDREMLADYEHPLLGTVKSVALPLKISGFHPAYRAAPALGADEKSLLSELGYSDANIAHLRRSGAFGPS